MHIILPSDVYPPRSGGAGWSAHALALALAARGHTVSVVVPREGGPARARRTFEGIAVVEVGYRASRIPFVRNYGRHERLWPRLAAAIQEQVVVGGSTLIHAQHVQVVPAALLAARRLGLPLVATVRDHWPWDYFATGLHGGRLPYQGQNWASLATDLPARLGPLPGALALPAIPYMLAHTRRRAAALAACDAVVAVSGYIARRLAGIIPAARLHRIPNLVDLVAIDSVVAQPSALVPPGPFLLFVGKLEPNKGAQLVPRILTAARAALPTGHPALERVVLAGNGSLQPLLARELGALGVEAIFLDWAEHDEVLRLLAGCTALLFPSVWGEPLSRVLLEAAACGAPILAMPSGGTPDIIADGVSGVLAATPAALGQRLATLLAKPEALRALGLAARQRAEAEFALPVVIGRFETLYAELLARNGCCNCSGNLVYNEARHVEAQSDCSRTEKLPMAALTVIAKLKAKPGSEQQLFDACHKLIAPTLAEEGCLNYDMHRSDEDPGLIMFHENWTSRELWQQHMNAPHLSAFSAETDGMVEVWELFSGTKVNQ